MEKEKAGWPLIQNLFYILKWTALACIIGSIGGAVGGCFAICVSWATSFRMDHSWVLYLMPAAGLGIVGLYRLLHEENNRGTNMVIEAVSSEGRVSAATGPLIFVSTVLTHLTGGSSGREGAALQIGGCIADLIGRLFKLDEMDKRIGIMCGMSAVFGALFGTPVAAGIFSLEVTNVGVLYYGALVPCLFSACLGSAVSGMMGVAAESYTILDMPEFSFPGVCYLAVLGVLCALVSIGFCTLLHRTEGLYRKYFKNPYIRILAASVIFIVLTLMSGTRDYNGSSMQLIEHAMEGQVRYEAFLLKAIFTAVALGAGFKGGEIVPTFCVGAAFGCTVGQITGMFPSFSAACGMAALFAGMTNCPVASIMIAMELFGGIGLPYFAIVIAVTFLLSGYYGLYGSQQFAYSKIKPQKIDRMSNH